MESCQPNPCQSEGKCVASGEKKVCQCRGHFTGRFCGLNMCELDPCVFGQCELTNSGFKVKTPRINRALWVVDMVMKRVRALSFSVQLPAGLPGINV